MVYPPDAAKSGVSPNRTLADPEPFQACLDAVGLYEGLQSRGLGFRVSGFRGLGSTGLRV